jgi:hypothetical protein
VAGLYLVRVAPRWLWIVAGVLGASGLALAIYEFVHIKNAFDEANRQLSKGALHLHLNTAFGGGLYLILIAAVAVLVGAGMIWSRSRQSPVLEQPAG